MRERFAITFLTSDHPNRFAVLDSYAETAAGYYGGGSYQTRGDGERTTWEFGTREAMDHFARLAWMHDHVRPVDSK
jgi:hypothetical protein